MTVQELINQLQAIEDKSLNVIISLEDDVGALVNGSIDSVDVINSINGSVIALNGETFYED